MQPKGKSKKSSPIFVILVFILLIVITLATNFSGSTDTLDYEKTAKFFADKYQAKVRSSHSYLLGFIHSPYLFFFNSFLIFKFTSLIAIALIILSTYLISGKNKKTLWLILLAPVFWYLGPWTSPIQLATLFFLWGYYNIKKYEQESKILNLIYSGIFIGVSYAFWDGVLFFGGLLTLSFLYNKKLTHLALFILSGVIGLLPRLILDQIIFNYAFFSVTRHFFAWLSFVVFGGFYGQGNDFGILPLISTIIFFPYFIYTIFTKKTWKEDKKTTIFIALSLFIIIFNSQIRLTAIITPIIILAISTKLTRKQLAIQIVMFLIVILIAINPYIIQTKYHTDSEEFTTFVSNFPNIKTYSEFQDNIYQKDLMKIAKEFPDETFVIGNRLDSYSTLAVAYWETDIKEFVSIQDYKLNFEGNPPILKKELCTQPKINNRRDLCASVSIKKASSDSTDYDSITYAISEESTIDLENYEFIKKYKKLYLFKKVS